MKKLTLLSLLIIFISSCAETKIEETQAELFARVDTEIQQNSQAYNTLKEASETIGHRLTGSVNGAKAEEYTYNKFKEYGFENVAYQTFEVEAWARETVALEIDNEAVKELGITEESLTLTVDRLTSSREKEEQKAELKELLSEAKKHQEKGDVSKALELLDNKVKEVKLKDKGTEFSKLLKATTESEIRHKSNVYILFVCNPLNCACSISKEIATNFR
jgi:hypothetical protein